MDTLRLNEVTTFQESSFGRASSWPECIPFYSHDSSIPTSLIFVEEFRPAMTPNLKVQIEKISNGLQTLSSDTEQAQWWCWLHAYTCLYYVELDAPGRHSQDLSPCLQVVFFCTRKRLHHKRQRSHLVRLNQSPMKNVWCRTSTTEDAQDFSDLI